jgi:nicotinamidase/pyrazinamidase
MSFSLSRRLFLASSGAILTTRAFAADKIKPGATSALLVVDVQNCFVDGGTLPVKGGAQIVPVINQLAPAFENIVVTQDWHTPGHT